MPSKELPSVSGTGGGTGEGGARPGTPSKPPEIPGFRIIEWLGEGGMGVVWRARQEYPGRDVALKVMKSSEFDAKMALRFREEVDLAGKLDHNNIVRVYYSPLDREPYFFTMPWIKGRNLDTYVSEEGLSPQGIMDLIRTVCLAMAYAHGEGVIHRDLKPSNILVTEEGAPHIVDFGLAKRYEDGADAHMSVSGAAPDPGTLFYMSPEQVRGKDVGPRSDIYSLGVTAYRLLTGRFPYDLSGSDFESRRNIVEQPPIPLRHWGVRDAHLESLVLTALAKESDERYQTMADFASDIELWREGRRPKYAKSRRSIYALRRRLNKRLEGIGVGGLLIIILSTFSLAAVQALNFRPRGDALWREYINEQVDARNAAESAIVLDRLMTLLHQGDRHGAERLNVLYAFSKGRKESAAAEFLLDPKQAADKSQAFRERLEPDQAWFFHLIVGEAFLLEGSGKIALDHFQASYSMLPEEERLHGDPLGVTIHPDDPYRERVMKRLIELAGSVSENQNETVTRGTTDSI